MDIIAFQKFSAGQDDYQSMLETWINFGSGFLLVYSIDDMESFTEVKKKYEKLTNIKKKMYLVLYQQVINAIQMKI